ncbi:MAG: hypothetical protein ACQESF_07045, partial [Nanobdellota archaeon]
MLNLLWFQLPMILLLGVVTSYTDIKFGKIRNKWILIALAYGTAIYFGAFLLHHLTASSLKLTLIVDGKEEIYSFFLQTLSNFLVSLLVGVLLWLYRMLSAADAKLYIAFSLLTPVTVYSAEFVRYFPGAILLINSIIIV